MTALAHSIEISNCFARPAEAGQLAAANYGTAHLPALAEQQDIAALAAATADKFRRWQRHLVAEAIEIGSDPYQGEGDGGPRQLRGLARKAVRRPLVNGNAEVQRRRRASGNGPMNIGKSKTIVKQNKN